MFSRLGFWKIIILLYLKKDNFMFIIFDKNSIMKKKLGY